MKPFLEEERSRIRNALRETAAVEFGRRGIRGTGIQDLCGRAGIASGSFYAFYDSKERLYAELLGERYAANAEAFRRVSAMTSRPAETLEALMKGALEAFRSDPLFRRMTDPEDRALLRRKLPEEVWKALDEASLGAMETFVRDWQARGLLVEGDPRTLALLLTSHFFLYLHADQIGEDRLDAVIALFARCTARGLTDVRRVP